MADPAEIWTFLTDRDRSKAIWGAEIKGEFKKGGALILDDGKECCRVKSYEPHRMMTLLGGTREVPITTTCEILPRGKRTLLKVTISGWENMDLDESKKIVPRISLEWERRLGLLKRSVEKECQKLARSPQ